MADEQQSCSIRITILADTNILASVYLLKNAQYCCVSVIIRGSHTFDLSVTETGTYQVVAIFYNRRNEVVERLISRAFELRVSQNCPLVYESDGPSTY